MVMAVVSKRGKAIAGEKRERSQEEAEKTEGWMEEGD